jgi:hypothetical protein
MRMSRSEYHAIDNDLNCNLREEKKTCKGLGDMIDVDDLHPMFEV